MMSQPELIFITGPNAAGKSSFIRSRMAGFENYEIIMTDAYKSKSKEVFGFAVKQKLNIILETPFNDESYKNLIDEAKQAGYHATLTLLFLEGPSQSLKRVVYRKIYENGFQISEGNVKYNFNESFKNVSRYFFYFDKSLFVYTGARDQNELIIKFFNAEIIEYKANDYQYIQKFADYAHSQHRLDDQPYQIIKSNKNYPNKLVKKGAISARLKL